jgi:hypothetical protein
MVERAVAQGELPPGTDPGLVVEALLGPIYFRLPMSREPLDDRFVRDLADLITGPPARSKGRRRAAS